MGNMMTSIKFPLMIGSNTLNDTEQCDRNPFQPRIKKSKFVSVMNWKVQSSLPPGLMLLIAIEISIT